jgi:hypothetical protein
LPWSDVALLIGALMFSCCLAIGFNMVSKLLNRG